MKQRIFAALMLLVLLLGLVPAAGATEPVSQPSEQEAVEIHTVEDLMAMGENPLGSYILMEDLDLAGVEWIPLDFQGSFDGNNHSILNLTLTQPGAGEALTYDGNLISYQTRFAGLFGILRNAQVKNLRLVNVRSVMEVDYPCFLGSVAGYCDNSNIMDCTVTGSLELRACKDIYGVGGVAGYGIGGIEECKIDVTLITVDTDPDTKAEQFLGGVYATGFINARNNSVTLEGYVSEFGYVHAGGLVGLYMQKPLGEGVSGRLTGNIVSGKITFFEHNTNRRAYCAAYAGETLAQTYIREDNEQYFQRKEIWADTTELRPCSCPDPSYNENVTPSTCNTFGYTEYTCLGCGFVFRDHYTLKTHNVTQWTMTQEPTTEEEGLSAGICDDCGNEFTRSEPKLEVVITEPTEPPVTEPREEKSSVILNGQLPLMAGGFAFLLLAAICFGWGNRKKSK